MTIIKMNFPAMMEMAQSFSTGKETIETMIGEINNVAAILAGGALIGRGGDAFEDACRNELVPTLQRLAEKFGEQSQDIIVAVESMQNADVEAKQRYQ